MPAAWLAAASFPVVLDPDIDISGSSADGWIAGASAATSTDSDANGTSLIVGGNTFGGAPHLWRSYLKFNTSSLGFGAEVEQVNLKMLPTAMLAYVAWSIYVRQYNWSANDPMGSASREAAWDGLHAAGNAGLLATQANPVGTQVTSQDLPSAWIQVEGDSYYGLWCNQEAYSFPNNQGAYQQYGSANHATPSYRPLLAILYQAGYPRSGPLGLQARLPLPHVSLVDTRLKLPRPRPPHVFACKQNQSVIARRPSVAKPEPALSGALRRCVRVAISCPGRTLPYRKHAQQRWKRKRTCG